MILCADLATAHGSFLLNGWKVWNNASISADAHIETQLVPVEVTLASHQTLWMGTRSLVRIDGRRILIQKGCAELTPGGAYSLVAVAASGSLAGSDSSELARAQQIRSDYESIRELRPASQRP